MVHKAERGEEVELNNRVLQNQIADIKATFFPNTIM